MKIITNCLSLLYFFCFLPHCFASIITCPPEEKIKAARFIHAIVNPYDPECWNFTSAVFMYQGHEWYVSFGSFFQDVKNPDDALKRGQHYFDTSSLIIKNPIPVTIPHAILCDYVPEGRAFWISALKST